VLLHHSTPSFLPFNLFKNQIVRNNNSFAFSTANPSEASVDVNNQAEEERRKVAPYTFCCHFSNSWHLKGDHTFDS
jgi:hypothetical protein